MTELEELKMQIAALVKRMDASDRKIAFLEETLSTLGNFKASKEMGEYIERQQNAIRMADMLSSFSDETIDMTVQKDNVEKLQEQQKAIIAEIAAEIQKSKANVVQDNSSIKYLKYKTNEKGIIITGCTAVDPVDIVIPDMIDGKPVIKIDDFAFRKSRLISLTLPDTLVEIRSYAFEHCKNLKSVKNLNCNIGDYSFFDCVQLSEINLGEGVKIIGKKAFCDCGLLSRVEFGKGIHSIEPLAFSNCKQLENVNLEKTQISILSRSCFENCGINHITFPKTLRIIEMSALSDNPLTNISIPDYVKEVDSGFADAERIAFLGNDTVVSGASFFLSNSTIYCLYGSKVQEYCQEQDIPYRPISEYPTE